DATYVFGSDGVYFVELPEKVTPVAGQRLPVRKLLSHIRIVFERANKICPGTALHAVELCCCDEIFFESFYLFIQSFFCISVRLAWCDEGVKEEEPGVLLTRKTGKAARVDRDALVAHERAIEPRRAAFAQ